MKRLLIAAAAIVMAPFSVPSAAEAASNYVYVQAPTGTKIRWSLRTNVPRIDYYTGSKVVLGSCRRGARGCVVIRETSRTACYPKYRRVAGCTSFSNGRWLVELDPGVSRTTWERKSVALHELGHAFGLAAHGNNCAYAMYKYSRCINGRPVGIKFTTAERRILRRH